MPKPFNTAISQIGVIVTDLQSSMEMYHKLFGWGPWYIYEYKPPWFHHAELRGEPTSYSMLTAEVEVGPIWFELVQPLDGPSIYHEWLDEHGEGLHHIIVGWDIPQPLPADQAPGAISLSRKDELEAQATAVRREFAAMGVDVLMGGRLGETSQFYYLDTHPLLKVIIESGGGDASDLQPIRTYP